MIESPQRNMPTLYLNIIWHQHQPLYLDPASDQLQGPWVRTHGTKDYYDMAAILERYPNIHCTVNLTSSLLQQLEEYYVARLKPFVDLKNNRINADKYFEKFGGRTDPWIDLALKPASLYNERDLQFLLTNVWNAFGVSNVMLDRFPEYKALKEKYKASGKAGLTEQDLREIIFWFYLAYFDPDFLEGTITLATGETIDLQDLVKKETDGTYRLRKNITQEDCNRIVVETYKVLAAIVPLHKKLMYRPEKKTGQLEIITTPYYHPILPLIFDSDLAKICQPNDPMPSRYHFPEDAVAQVAKAVIFYRKQFGRRPTGMWPAEGAVAHDIVPVFGKNKIEWIATDEKVLARSRPSNLPKFYPYAISTDHKKEEKVVIVFRDTELSDKIGFVYQHLRGEEAAEDFIRHVLRSAPTEGQPDRLLTVILDGENAWEWYRYDNDGKEFLHSLYRKLSQLHDERKVVTTSVTEYLRGNERRGIPAHPIETLPKLEWLWPGSWINANYDTWIGEEEENRAWEYLLTVRNDLAESGLKQPDSQATPRKKKTQAWYAYLAWESLYAAEGSDWFWWYGTDQTAPSGDKPFDVAYITHLNNVYRFGRLAGGKLPERRFEPIIRSTGIAPLPSQGTMAQSREDLVTVVFQVDARATYVRKAIYIVGNIEQLGNWVPNKVRMYDDGTHGDEKGDGIWSLELMLPPGLEIEYKYTNSGAEGSWSPGEEFPIQNRRVKITAQPGERQLIHDIFGQI